MSRLDHFLTRDYAARKKAMAWSIGIGFGVGLLGQAMGIPFKQSAYGSAATVFMIYSMQVWTYCNIRSARRISLDALWGSRRAALAFAPIVVIVLVNVTPISVAQEALVNSSLQRLTVGRKLAPKAATRISNSLRAAATGQPIRLALPILVEVREAIKMSEPTAPTAAAANALIQYARAVNPPPLINPPRNETERAFLEGGKHFSKALSTWPAPPDNQELFMAVSNFSTCIDQAGSDEGLRIDALLMRGTAYNILGRSSEAFADAQTAERLGSFELSTILSIETSALVERGTPEYLRQAIPLLTLGLQLDPPEWVVALDPRMATMYKVEQLEKRAFSYYGLGNFNNAIDDTREALTLAPPAAFPVPSLYLMMIRSYLQLGVTETASAVASEWLSKTGNPLASEVRRVIRENRTNPERALTLLRNL
jgi:tetratricopeptide (TPR) repeat protein